MGISNNRGTKRSKIMRVDPDIFAPEIEQLMKDKDLDNSRQATRVIGKQLRNVRVGKANKRRIRF